MQYVHVRNLGKYQDGYKDRRHYWAKIFIEMIQGNRECEMLGEIEWARLVKFIVMEACSQKPTPLDERFLTKRGFDFGIQSLDSTVRNLSHFIEIINVTETHETVTEPSPRREEKRIEEIRKDIARFQKPSLEELKDLFREKGFPAEAEKFFDYYEANGWRVGRNPMKNWRAAVANWLRHAKNFGTARTGEVAGLNLNKKQAANMEALRDFTERKGAAGPKDLRAGDGHALVRLPGD